MRKKLSVEELTKLYSLDNEDFDVETKIRILKRLRLACVKEYKKYRDEQSLNRLDAIHNNLLKLF